MQHWPGRRKFYCRPPFDAVPAVKKKPSSLLLTILALTAAGGAALFLTILTVIQNGARDESRSARAEQERAHAAAVKGARAREAAHAAALLAQMQPPPPRAISGKTVYIRRAQRKFLMDRSHWKPSRIVEMDALAANRRAKWEKWTSVLLDPGSDAATASGAATALAESIPEFRWEMENFCFDLTKLTPAARKEWKTREAEQWMGYNLHTGSAGSDVDPIIDEPVADKTVLTEFQARKVSVESRLALAVWLDEVQASQPSSGGLGTTWRDGPHISLERLRDDLLKIISPSMHDPELQEISGLIVSGGAGDDLTDEDVNAYYNAVRASASDPPAPPAP